MTIKTETVIQICALALPKTDKALATQFTPFSSTRLSVNTERIDFVHPLRIWPYPKLKFTKREYDILKYFIQHDGEVVHRHDLLEHVWGLDHMPTTRTVDNFILDIRKKIEEVPSLPKFIVSVSGVGYRFQSGNT
jgi:DNA-binding response OmpR family regulator